jgi:hypothetical protein
MALLLWASFHRHSTQPWKVARPTRAFRPMGPKQGRAFPLCRWCLRRLNPASRRRGARQGVAEEDDGSTRNWLGVVGWRGTHRSDRATTRNPVAVKSLTATRTSGHRRLRSSVGKAGCSCGPSYSHGGVRGQCSENGFAWHHLPVARAQSCCYMKRGWQMTRPSARTTTKVDGGGQHQLAEMANGEWEQEQAGEWRRKRKAKGASPLGIHARDKLTDPRGAMAGRWRWRSWDRGGGAVGTMLGTGQKARANWQVGPA